MSLPIVENLSGLQESIFNLSRGPQVHFTEKSENLSNFIKFTDFPPFPLFGVPWAAVILTIVPQPSDSSQVITAKRCLLHVHSMHGASLMPPP